MCKLFILSSFCFCWQKFRCANFSFFHPFVFLDKSFGVQTFILFVLGLLITKDLVFKLPFFHLCSCWCQKFWCAKFPFFHPSCCWWQKFQCANFSFFHPFVIVVVNDDQSFGVQTFILSSFLFLMTKVLVCKLSIHFSFFFFGLLTTKTLMCKLSFFHTFCCCC